MIPEVVGMAGDDFQKVEMCAASTSSDMRGKMDLEERKKSV